MNTDRAFRALVIIGIWMGILVGMASSAAASETTGRAEWPPAATQADIRKALMGIRNVACEQAREILQERRGDTNFVVLDFRTKEMFDEAHIAGATCQDEFLADIDDWLGALDKEKTYLIYCTAGYRSGVALEKMKSLGFANILHMNEGIRRWKKLGYETVSENTSPAVPPLADQLKILEPLVNGRWVGEMKSPDGSRIFRSEVSFQAVWDGLVMKYAASIPEVNSFSEGYFFFDRETQKVAVFIISSRGGVERGTVSVENGVLTVQGAMTFPDRTFDFKNTFEFTADGKMTDRWFQNAFGSWQPGHVVEYTKQKVGK